MTDIEKSPDGEFIWTYGGYKLGAGNFATAMIHLYRGEVTRSNLWRTRLDTTTNWAVIATTAAISFAFAQPNTHHSVIILMTVMVTLFLLIEARRYRYYELWSYRVRLIETDFYAAMLVPPFRPREDWSKNLAESLLDPEFPISMLEAFGRRLRRNYMWLYLILGLAWLAKLVLFPEGINEPSEILEHSKMGVVPGWIVMVVQGVFYTFLLAVGLWTRRLRHATGEVLDRKVHEIEELKAKTSAQVAEKQPHS